MSAMENIAISATKREVSGKRVKTLRAAGKLPAVLYGHNIENKQLEISEKDFSKAFKQAGESTLVNLAVDGKTHPVLIHDVQHHYLSGKPTHVDFYAVNMTQKLKVKVPIHLLNESPAVKALGGTLVRNLSEVEVECLPSDIPQAFEVDISTLNTFEDAIRVSSLQVGDKVAILTPADEVIANVAPPRSEEEMNALNAEVKEDVTAVEGVVKPEAPVEGAVDEKAAKKEDKKEEKK
ncbi:MAG: 50S ribosomal protein L25 [Candidatus Doudnabacteria bacterium]|nr:50S ribosomal protein L25 [Candidatus Doudnabacteria bacterium]